MSGVILYKGRIGFQTKDQLGRWSGKFTRVLSVQEVDNGTVRNNLSNEQRTVEGVRGAASERTVRRSRKESSGVYRGAEEKA